jgi:antitoxin ParD1/3/4
MATEKDADEQARIRAFREAVQIGMADIEAGRYRMFDNPGELSRHLASIADEIADSFRTRPRKQPPPSS